MIRASLIVALLFALVGCGGPPPPLPAATLDKASDGLRASLDAWKKGDSFESWKKRSPVAFTDQDWQAGAKLLEYEIKRVEGLSGENARGWVVLSLKDRRGKTVSREVVYEINTEKAVIARDPFN